MQDQARSTGIRPRVAVITAMRQEMRPITKALGLRRVAGERLMWEGSADRVDVVAAVTQMGTAAATRTTARLLSGRPVDHVIVSGICGGIDTRLPIGHLLSPAAVIDDSTGREVRPQRIGRPAGATRSGTGQVGVPHGVLVTTDDLHFADGRVRELVERGIVAVDMETAAVGLACEQMGCPWSMFRAISDRAGDNRTDEEVFNLAKPDGSANVLAIAKFVATRPRMIPHLATLGRGMRLAVKASSDATLEAIAHHPFSVRART